MLARLKRNAFNRTSEVVAAAAAAATAENDQFGKIITTRQLHQQTKSAKKYQPEDVRADTSENKRVLMLNQPPTGFDSHLNSGNYFEHFLFCNTYLNLTSSRVVEYPSNRRVLVGNGSAAPRRAWLLLVIISLNRLDLCLGCFRVE